MGQRQDKLKQIVFKRFNEYKHNKLTEVELINSVYHNNVKEIYKKLEGKLTSTPINFGTWDISTIDFIIEFDEERHFNRYRLQTLTSNIYRDYKLFSTSSYTQYCKQFENNCLSAAGWGKNWKNDSTEKMFIASGIEKDLTGNGSSRWRQRAYYDFLKDVTSTLRKIPLIRISIYDVFQNRTVDELLTSSEDRIIGEYIENLTKVHWC